MRFGNGRAVRCGARVVTNTGRDGNGRGVGVLGTGLRVRGGGVAIARVGGIFTAAVRVTDGAVVALVLEVIAKLAACEVIVFGPVGIVLATAMEAVLLGVVLEVVFVAVVL